MLEITDPASYLAQLTILVFLLTCASHRRSLTDYTDHNVERLERERIHAAAQAARARLILWRMGHARCG